MIIYISLNNPSRNGPDTAQQVVPFSLSIRIRLSSLSNWTKLTNVVQTNNTRCNLEGAVNSDIYITLRQDAIKEAPVAHVAGIERKPIRGTSHHLTWDGAASLLFRSTWKAPSRSASASTSESLYATETSDKEALIERGFFFYGRARLLNDRNGPLKIQTSRLQFTTHNTSLLIVKMTRVNLLISLS